MSFARIAPSAYALGSALPMRFDLYCADSLISSALLSDQ